MPNMQQAIVCNNANWEKFMIHVHVTDQIHEHFLWNFSEAFVKESLW